jgi:NAD(P)-dependent dehydrogenase (short-subunit alcohol dehydrogenase family)
MSTAVPSSGRRVLITAGAAGIGLATARAFARAGDAVHVSDADEGAVAALLRTDPALVAATCDVSDREAVQRWVGQSAGELGGIDVLVSNAGIAGPTAPVADVDPDDWDRVLAVNLTGAFLLVRAAIPHLRPGASIVIMSSLAGRFGFPLRAPYCASKWGLIGLTKTLAIELGGNGVRVNAVLPGAVAGPRLDRVLDDRAAAIGRTRREVETGLLAKQSLQRFIPPEEIAATVLFLCSDAAASISGQAISVDGDAQTA